MPGMGCYTSNVKKIQNHCPLPLVNSLSGKEENISANFRKNNLSGILTVLEETVNHDRNQKSKISCQTPFKQQLEHAGSAGFSLAARRPPARGSRGSGHGASYRQPRLNMQH